ncbi:hypothetical protein BBJ28_00010857 [Nothophytophthora sp. Chile5]|nr:hypothetical protein BBJ28_00010857 [Nothophytophthora sp. Chile5]
MLVGHVLDLTTEVRALKAQNGPLTATIEALQQRFELVDSAQGAARVDEQHQPPPTPLRLKQLPRWPKNLRLMKGVRFADCIYQRFWGDLEKVPSIKGSKSESNAQSECMKAFSIAKQYITKDEKPRPYASMRNEDEQLAWSTHVRALAESVEARVIKDLKDCADHPKKRKSTVFVSATIREHYKQSKARKAKNSVNWPACLSAARKRPASSSPLKETGASRRTRRVPAKHVELFYQSEDSHDESCKVRPSEESEIAKPHQPEEVSNLLDEQQEDYLSARHS